MRRTAVVVAVAVGLLAAACSRPGSGPAPAPPPSPSASATLARGAVAVGVVHTCGAGGRACPLEFRRLLSRDLKRHDGLPFATTDTVIFPSNGCGGALRAPFGTAAVSDSTIRWHVDWVGAGPDCDGSVIGFVRFARPVYDMDSPISLIATWTNVGTHRHVYRSTLFAAPDLARWVRPGWRPPRCRFCLPGHAPGSG